MTVYGSGKGPRADIQCRVDSNHTGLDGVVGFKKVYPAAWCVRFDRDKERVIRAGCDGHNANLRENEARESQEKQRRHDFMCVHKNTP